LWHGKYRIINSPARGKKKFLKDFLPILTGVKMNAVFLLSLVYVGINLIAKKAILISLISFAASALLTARKPLRQRVRQQQDVSNTCVTDRGGDWDGALGTRNGHALYGSDSSSTAHTLAYGTQKVFRM
jgi:hypothetical protein